MSDLLVCYKYFKLLSTVLIFEVSEAAGTMATVSDIMIKMSYVILVLIKGHE